MSNYIYSPNKQKDTEENTVKYYCLSGNEDFIDDDGFPRRNTDDSFVLAKLIIKQGGQPQHYIKLANTNKLYNPINVIKQESSSSFLDNVCRPADKFKSVNNKVFSMYINFLLSKNILWFHKAERETV